MICPGCEKEMMKDHFPSFVCQDCSIKVFSDDLLQFHPGFETLFEGEWRTMENLKRILKLRSFQ